MSKRKTLPLRPTLNRLAAVAVSSRRTAENILRDQEKFSSLEVARRIADEYIEKAAAYEGFAEELVRWENGEVNHIFNYHDKVTDERELRTVAEIERRAMQS